MPTLELLVVVLLALLVGSVLGRRWGIAPPLVLLVLGAALGVVPAFRQVVVPSDVVLLLILPALLYWESLTTSLREIRANQRAVLLVSVGLVVLTAAAVAVVLHAVGMAWGPAWVLGAVLAPTDATAVAGVVHGLPRRFLTTLRAESLVNDGTALVVYAIVVHAVSEPVSGGYVAGTFLLSYLGGITAGAVTWRLVVLVRGVLREPLQQSVISVLTPLAAFLLAESVHASGVLAVVTAGLLLSQSGPRLIPAAARLQATAFWAVLAHLLSGGLFVLVGIQLYGAVAELSSTGLLAALGATLAAFGAVLGSRLLWFWTVPYALRVVDRRPQQRARRVPSRQRVPIAWAGFRGAVSLALALGLPQTTTDGTPFPERDLIVFATCGVILATLLVQGLTLPAVVRWARLPQDEAMDDERRRADQAALSAALRALPLEAARLGTDPEVLASVMEEYRSHADTLDQLDRCSAGARAEPGSGRRQADDLRLAVLDHERAAVVGLRDQQHIDDIVLRDVQARLDLEEIRLLPMAAGADD